MKRTIKNPHWTNNARTIMSAEFHYDDGRVVTAVISDTDAGNPDMQEIKRLFTDEQLEENTLRQIKKINNERVDKKQKEEAAIERKKQEELFALKLKAFEIEVVKNSMNRNLKSKIRRSKNDFEVLAYTAALIISEESLTEQTTEQSEDSTSSLENIRNALSV